METIAKLLAYPVFEVGIIADKFGSGLGVSLFAFLLFFGGLLLYVERPWLSNKNAVLIVSLFLPYFFWSLSLKFSTNSGVGNLIIEFCALITVMLGSCIVYKVICMFKVKKIERMYLLPQSILFVFVVLFRLFMPLVGKINP